MPCRVGAEASLEHYQTRKQHPLRGINPNDRIWFNKPARSISMTLLFFLCRQISCFWRRTASKIHNSSEILKFADSEAEKAPPARATRQRASSAPTLVVIPLQMNDFYNWLNFSIF